MFHHLTLSLDELHYSVCVSVTFFSFSSEWQFQQWLLTNCSFRVARMTTKMPESNSSTKPETETSPRKLRIITYLSPGIPLVLFDLLRDYLEAETGLEAYLIYESRWSGPPPDRKDPFTTDEVDIGRIFIALNYRWYGWFPSEIKCVIGGGFCSLQALMELEHLWMNEWKFIYGASKTSTQNLAWSQRHIVHTDTHSAYTSALISYNYQKTFMPIKYKQPLPTHPLPKVQLYIAVKYRDTYRV